MSLKIASCAALLMLAAALSSVACARAQARTVPEPPDLDMPAPPPRVVEVSDSNVPPPLPLPSEPERNPPPRIRSAPPARAEAPKPEPPKVDQPVAETAKPPEEPAKLPPATTLQTAPADREGEIEGRIRAALYKAAADLGRVNYRNLTTDARNQYDTAKGFMRQAEDARRARNLDFARNLADKAAALAAQLAGR
jgi:hypothetical protein